jgi:MoxR-like ATPase
LNASDVKHYRDKVGDIHIEANLISYIAKIVNQTRNNSALYLGASPRASLSILTSSKAIAAMRGRDFVTPDDIKFVATPVLKHRVMLTPEKEMEGLTTTEIIKQIIEKIEIPR